MVPVGQEVIDRVPKQVKDLAIEWFGSADKAVLVVGTLLSLAVIGSIVGTLAVRGRRLNAYAVTVVVGVIGVFAVWMRPAPDFGKMLPPIMGTLASIAVVWQLAPRQQRGELGEVPVAAEGGLARRGFVEGAAMVAAASVLVGGVGRVLKRRFEVGDERAALELPKPVEVAPTLPTDGGANDETATTAEGSKPMELDLEGLDPWLTSSQDFYRIDTAIVVPQVPKDSWKLRVFGMVDLELEITFADLLARPMVERYVTLSCVSNEIGGDLVGNAKWQGVLLKDVLDEAGVQAGATQVVSRSIDGWSCGSPTSAIMDGRDAMLAVAMNGEPLPAEHGYPVRLVVPGLYGYVSATKWVTEIELTRWEDFDGYWIPRGWSKEGPVKTMARIDRPKKASGSRSKEGEPVDIAGLAWAVHRGISRVEVQIDDGEWRHCDLAGVPSDDTWVQWVYRWIDASAGRHRVRARAYDGSREPQPSDPKGVAPNGAQGYHEVSFEVDEV